MDNVLDKKIQEYLTQLVEGGFFPNVFSVDQRVALEENCLTNFCCLAHLVLQYVVIKDIFVPIGSRMRFWSITAQKRGCKLSSLKSSYFVWIVFTLFKLSLCTVSQVLI